MRKKPVIEKTIIQHLYVVPFVIYYVCNYNFINIAEYLYPCA